MRSSDLFTAIAEKSRPTATTHSRDRERNPRTAVSHCAVSGAADPDTRADRRTAPTSPPGRVTSLVSWLVGPVPACRSDYLYRLPVLERRRGFALSPGTAYRRIRRDAIPRRRIGFDSGIRGSRTCGSRRSRTRYTRHATHGHTPKSAIRSIVVLVVRGVLVGHGCPKGACPICRKRGRFSYIQYQSCLRHTIQVSTSSRSCASCDSHRGDPGLNHTSSRFEDRHTPRSPDTTVHRFAH